MVVDVVGVADVEESEPVAERIYPSMSRQEQSQWEIGTNGVPHIEVSWQRSWRNARWDSWQRREGEHLG